MQYNEKMISWYYITYCRATEAQDSMEEFVPGANCCSAWWALCSCSPKH